ncbi:hypothetical protein OIU77_021126 [Salix suchowensis]|uniref:Gelsolin-like domain-containing protein n=1 Tax=Salix suchowensis TaxID=1278906 RepID=A0ABQ9C9N1_9ROSI|nr:hypothetical protein OIU77_021126 [Salix suchowensis]KAJ6396019.1 hypothetical protein OIU77_021126 [Salix suchowensis]
MQALQVEPVAPSLNSSYCYILHNDSSVFTWTGNLTTSEDQELMERQLDLIKPNTQSKPQKEESNSFPFLPWFCYCKNLRSSAGNLKTYLSAVEFREKFGMEKDLFLQRPAVEIAEDELGFSRI